MVESEGPVYRGDLPPRNPGHTHQPLNFVFRLRYDAALLLGGRS